MDSDWKIQALLAARAARLGGVAEYQLNIDNFRRAIARIGEQHSGDGDMQEFCEQLTKLLADNVREQKKEQLLLDVITEQLEELDALP